MKLYSKSQVDWLKHQLRYLISVFSFTRIIQFLIIYLFAKLWTKLVLSLGMINSGFIGLSISLILPIILLIAILQYRSHLAYFTVILICIYSVLVDIGNFIHNIKAYLRDDWFGSVPLEYVIKQNLISLGVIFIALTLLHNKRIVNLYNWKKSHFYYPYWALLCCT